MNPQQVMSAIQSLSGQHIKVQFRTESKPRAEFKGTLLEKQTEGTYRAGISFENLRGVREGIESGERGEVQSPKGKKWITFPFHLQHESKGTDYLRLYYPTGGFIQRPSVTYRVNGQEVDREVFTSYLTPSDAKPKERDPNLDCFDIKMENLISIG